MKKPTSKRLDRKVWTRPEIKCLKFSDTLGGPNANLYEDFPDFGSID